MLDNLQLLFVYAPVMNVQMIFDGIFIGAVFALAAYGLALVWGARVIGGIQEGEILDYCNLSKPILGYMDS